MPRLSAPSLSIEQLERILNARRAELRKLTKQRDRLARRLDAIDRRIRAFGGSAGATNGKRARNAQSLTTVIESVLKNAANRSLSATLRTRRCDAAIGPTPPIF